MTLVRDVRKRALLVAYHFPPIRASSGIQRALAFTRYLGDYGWEPMVLTVRPGAYETVHDSQLADIPAGTLVRRACAFDARRHFAIKGSYPAWLAVPDRWATWFPGGVISGLRLVRRYRPDVIWSTFPIATAHLIAWAISRLTGIPWIADCRDPITEPGYEHRPAHLWLERKVVQRAARISFTTPSTLRLYAERYPGIPGNRWVELPNGYDEDIFQSVGTVPPRAGGGPVRLLHSGVIYPAERDPRTFFEAVSRLKTSGVVNAGSLRVVLRATGHDEIFRPVLARLDVADIVELAGAIPYREALREMQQADGLLVFQAANCNIQIPAKAYEYLRAGRPILAVTDAQGDTAAMLRHAGAGTIVAIDDVGAIATGLREFLAQIRDGTSPLPSEAVVSGYSRKALTARLAACFDEVTGRSA